MASVLWAFRTTHFQSTTEIPYSLAYNIEAIIPLEVSLPTLKSTQLYVVGNEPAVEEDLDFAESRRQTALLYLTNYQNAVSKQRQPQVNPRVF